MTPSVAMRHLLWKDYRQARPALWACLIMLACIQVLYLIAQLFDQGTDTATVQGAYFIALIAPTLVAMACSGLLIGQERQTRTWNWSSSLPVSWSSALASKFIVWLVASIVTTVVLLALYAVLYRLALLSGRSPTASAAWQISEIQTMEAMLVLVPIEVFVIFSIAALLWNDTLLALVIAAIVLCAGHLLVIDSGTRIIHGIPRNYPTRLQDHLPTAVSLLVLAIGLAALGLCYAFRWRWTSGQLASLSLRGWLRFGGGKSGGDASLAYASGYSESLAYASGYRVGRPSETGMMFAQAWRSGLGICVGIVIAALALLAGAPNEWRIFPPVLVAASLLLGVSVFGSEHPQGRYRFFADRGASWVRFLIAHVSVGLGWQVVLFALAYGLLVWQGSRTDFGFPSVLGVALAAFGLAVFSSLCISNAVIATAFAGLALFACAIFYEIADSYWSALIGQRDYVVSALPLTVAIFAAGLIYQARRWFVFDRPHSFRVLLTAGLVGLFAPLWLWLTFGYLTIPAVPWQGVPVDQVHIASPRRLPRLAVYLPDIAAMPLTPLSPSPMVAQELIADSYRGQLWLIVQRHGSVAAWLDTWKEPLEEIREELSNREAFAPANSLWPYSNMIEQMAFLGVAATQARDRAFAAEAWRLNHALLELAQDDREWVVQSLNARTATWGLWNLLSEDDIDFLKDQSDLSSLLPDHVDNAVWSHTLRVNWTLRKLALTNDSQTPVGAFHTVQGAFIIRTVRYYPPLRWAVERQMALQLNEELEVLEGRGSQVASVGAPRLPGNDIVYQIQTLRQLEEQVAAKIAQAQ